MPNHPQPLNPPHPFACTPRGDAATYDWYSYAEGSVRVVEIEIDKILDAAPSEFVRIDWQSIIETLREDACCGTIKPVQDKVRHLHRGDEIYELKEALRSEGKTTTALRMYVADLEVTDKHNVAQPTIGNFLVGTKDFKSESKVQRREQNKQIELASKRCDRECSEGHARRV